MTRPIAFVLLSLSALSLGWAMVQSDSARENSKVPNTLDDGPQAVLMRAKLASTQRIVDGLVSKDFGDIAKGAQELIKICKADEWRSHQDEIYGHYRRELTRQAEKMANAARLENLDGAAYSYIHALTTCIACHDHCRDVLKIAQDGPVVPIPTTDEAAAPQPFRR